MKQAVNVSNAFTSFPHRNAAALSEVLHRIYEAGTQPKRWTAAVVAIAESFGCTKALLFTPFVSPHDGGLLVPCGIVEDALQRRALAFVDGDSRISETGLKGHFAGDVLCKGIASGIEPGIMATWLAVFRDVDAPPFNDSDREWMQLLVSHVSRSLGVMQRLDTALLGQDALLSAFDLLCFGVVLLDTGMRMVHVNARAQKMLDRLDGLALSGHQLDGMIGPYGQMQLAQWLNIFRDASPARRMLLADGILVPRKDQRSHYVVQCAALAAPPHSESSGTQFHYVAFITDPAALQSPGAERLMQLYGLTPTQSLVALAFARGASYKEAARSLAISEDTVRSHVKEIYPKMRINRRADLVRLVLALGATAIHA